MPRALSTTLVIVSLACAASPSLARPDQTADAPVAQTGAASPEVRAEGDALIAAAAAQDVFVNESADGAIVLRHLPSGFRCVLNPGAPLNRVTLFPHPKRGHNVGCTSQTISGSQTVYFTESATAAEGMEFDIAVAGIRQRFPGARAVRPDRNARPLLVAPPGTTLPKARVAVFTSERGDERVDVGQRGAWVVKHRYSAPKGFGKVGGPLDLFWVTTVLEGERWRAAQPRGASAPTAPVPRAPSPAAVPLPPLDVQRSRAQAVLEAANAVGVFALVEDAGRVKYRHVASGLMCSFDSNGRLVTGAGSARMDDAGCVTLSDDAATTTRTRVRRRRGQETAGGALQAAVSELRVAHPSLKPAHGPGLAVKTDRKDGKALPVHSTLGLEGRVDGRAVYARVGASVAGDWVLTKISLGPAGDRIQADLMGELELLADLESIAAPR
jgi:hypothetical protein